MPVRLQQLQDCVLVHVCLVLCQKFEELRLVNFVGLIGLHSLYLFLHLIQCV